MAAGAAVLRSVGLRRGYAIRESCDPRLLHFGEARVAAVISRRWASRSSRSAAVQRLFARDPLVDDGSSTNVPPPGPLRRAGDGGKDVGEFHEGTGHRSRPPRSAESQLHRPGRRRPSAHPGSRGGPAAFARRGGSGRGGRLRGGAGVGPQHAARPSRRRPAPARRQRAGPAHRAARRRLHPTGRAVCRRRPLLGAGRLRRRRPGYLHKSAGSGTVTDGLRRVLDGGVYADPSIASLLAIGVRGGADRGERPPPNCPRASWRCCAWSPPAAPTSRSATSYAYRCSRSRATSCASAASSALLIAPG